MKTEKRLLKREKVVYAILLVFIMSLVVSGGWNYYQLRDTRAQIRAANDLHDQLGGLLLYYNDTQGDIPKLYHWEKNALTDAENAADMKSLATEKLVAHNEEVLEMSAACREDVSQLLKSFTPYPGCMRLIGVHMQAEICPEDKMYQPLKDTYPEPEQS